ETNQRAVASSDVLTAADLEAPDTDDETAGGIGGLSWRQVGQELLPSIDSNQEFTDVALGVEIDALHSEPAAYRTRVVWREATAAGLEAHNHRTARLRPLRIG